MTGKPPIDRERFKKIGLDEMLRVIRDEEPLRPSRRLSTDESLAIVAQQRQIDLRQLCDSVGDQLDWIAMKSLEKNRTRRYETVKSLARDIERYLAGEPIEASPGSAMYHVKGECECTIEHC